jgi:TP901 family phage tail tape measure protein
MAVFLDVLPRLGLTEAETAFAKLKEMALKTGDEMGVSLGSGASAGLDKLKESAIATERVVSDANSKMASSAGLLSAAQERAAATATAAASAQKLYSDALERQNALGVLTLAQSRELDALQTKATATSIAATTASARATDAAAKATVAERDHGDASLAAAAASSKFAAAKDETGKSVLATSSILSGVGAGSFLAFGAAMAIGADKAAAFQQSQTKLVASAGETTQGMKQVSDGILAMAGSVGYSAGELSSAMYVVEKAGFDASKGGLDVLKASAQGANAEQADLAEVTKGLTISMNDFHFPTQNAADVMSKLVVATGASSATFQEFTGALHSVEPAAAAAGIKYEDLLATISRGTKSGASADQVTENIRNAINALSGAQAPARAAMAQLGISADDVSQHLGQRGLAGTMQYLADTIKSKMDPNNLIPTGVFKQNAQELDNMTASLAAMSPAAAQLATGLRNGSVSAIEFRKGMMGTSGEDTQRLRDFAKWNNDIDDFSKRYKNGQSTLETYNQALRDVTGTVSGQTIALQVTGENAGATNDLIAKLTNTTREHDGTVKGFNETQETLSAKMRDAKAALGAAAIEMGNVFVPALTKGADGLKTIAEFLAQHKTLVTDAVVAVGLLGATWAAVKVGLAAQSTWTALAGGIDLAVAKFAALRTASTETAAVVETDAAAEATAVRGIGTAALGALAAIVAVGTEGPTVQKWAEDNIPGAKQLDALPNPGDAGKWVRDHWFGGDPNAGVADKFGSVPKVFGDQDTGPTNPERRGNIATGGDVVAAARAAVAAATTPQPGDGALPVATQLPGSVPDPGTPGSGIGDTSGGAKPPKATKDDPIWVSPSNPSDFKSTDDHGTTGTSILSGGFDLSPKSIGTFFTAMLVDLAVGNPIGKTLADKQKLGGSASNPMYVSQVDVDSAQSKLDKAIRDNGPDSESAQKAGRELEATRAAVGTTGGYYDPATGAIGARANLDENGNYSGGVGGGGPKVNPGKGAEGWRSTVADTVAKYGAAAGIPQSQYGNWTDAIVRQIDTESKGNPGADNPNDSNGRGGRQHVAGLLQYLPSTFANSAQKLTGVSDMMDPTAQIAGALLAGKNSAGAPTDIGNGIGWGPSRQPVDTSLVRNAPVQAPAPAAAAPGGGGDGSILGNLRDLFSGGGGLGPVFKKSPAPGGGGSVAPGTFDNSPAAVKARENADPAFQHLIGHDVPARTSGTGPSPFAPGGALSAMPGAPSFTPAIPGAAGGLGPQSPGFVPFPTSKPAAAAPAPNAAPGSHMAPDASKPGVGNSVANTPRSWGSGKGASASVGSSIIAAAGPLAAMAPGSAQAAQLADRTIGYVAQVGGIAVEGLMQSLIPTGGGGGIGDPSKSVLGKIAGGVAGAHKSAPNTAGTTAAPGPKAADDQSKQQPGGDTNHIGTQQSGGINTQGGDVHITAASPQQFASDQPQNMYPTATR